MKIIYNDKVVIPYTIPVRCRYCVFGGSSICKASNFCKTRNILVQVFRRGRCMGFKYEDSI